MENKSFTLEDVEKCFKEHVDNNQKMLEDKLKTFTPLNEDKIKEIVSKKIMEFEVPLNKSENKTPFETFKEQMDEIIKIKNK